MHMLDMKGHTGHSLQAQGRTDHSLLLMSMRTFSRVIELNSRPNDHIICHPNQNTLLEVLKLK